MAKKKKDSGSKSAKKKKALKKSAPKKAAAKKTQPVKKEAKKTKPPKASAIKPASKKTKQVKKKPVKAGAVTKAATKTMAAETGKRRLMISYEKLPHEVIDVIRTKYPYGYNHDLREVKGIDNKKFFVLPIELPEVTYLVKVDLRKPIKIENPAEEEDIFTPAEEFTAEEDSFPAAELEQIEGDDEGEEEDAKKKKSSDDDAADDGM